MTVTPKVLKIIGPSKDSQRHGRGTYLVFFFNKWSFFEKIKLKKWFKIEINIWNYRELNLVPPRSRYAGQSEPLAASSNGRDLLRLVFAHAQFVFAGVGRIWVQLLFGHHQKQSYPALFVSTWKNVFQNRAKSKPVL
jgi:hypothetical protein